MTLPPLLVPKLSLGTRRGGLLVHILLICELFRLEVPVNYKGIKLSCSYRLDLIVEDLVIVEIKSIEKLMPVHEAQLLTYLKLLDKKVGLLLNFNVPILIEGLKRMVNNF